MNAFKKKILVSALAMPLAAMSGFALAQDSTTTNDSSSLKLEKTLSHDQMMNREDAKKHDEIVRHDREVKEAAAQRKSTMNSGDMHEGHAVGAGASAASAAQARKDATEAQQDRMNDRMDAKKDAIDARKDRMEDRMDAHKDAVDSRQDRMNDSMDAQKDAQQATLDARRENLENQADAKKERVEDKDSSQPVTDTWITTKVKATLATTDGVSSTDVSVNTVDGTVYLTGVVDDAASIEKATAAARDIKGVKKVDASGLKVMR